jgi:lantibiotic biosynthesis protein
VPRVEAQVRCSAPVLASHTARRLNELTETGQITQPATALYDSYVHLHCNRLLNPDGPSESQIIALLQRTRYGLSQAPVTSALNG